MAIAVPNCRALVERPDGTVIATEDIANMQETGGEAAPPEYDGAGLDDRPAFRIRINVPRDPSDPTQYSRTIPTKGDIALVTQFAMAPALTGRWEILRVKPCTGLLASLILYVKRPLNQFS